jgi:hypothetical protein
VGYTNVEILRFVNLGSANAGIRGSIVSDSGTAVQIAFMEGKIK